MTSPDHSHERPEGRDPSRGGASDPSWNTGRLRGAVERRSAVSLLWLHQLPAWVTPLVLGLLFIGGLMFPIGPVGAVFLAAVGLFLGWLAYLTWPSLTGQQKAPRVLMVIVVLVLATARVLGF
ncbi:hypothetical protein IDM40_23560 [Nocardiopsis sp. HNM0947]|uniref:Uncharacterized protein n=1 Tax=Nocardiopsis coralli TaxID=2772213 RepID=A0ABR9PCT5_9ACTN|nr:DUF6703 family protein [Nocardiopsis coralli]MBE3001648.1 hypothetical protein [Nocardiopsis coralli]